MNITHSRIDLRSREEAGMRLPLLLLTFFLLGAVASAFWFYRISKHNPAIVAGNLQPSPLSDSTRTILAHLTAPVEIRFYSLLDPASVSEPLRDFAGRVAQLLSEYQEAANGMVKIVRFNTPSDSAAADAASADGLKPFNLDKGEGCYLGLTVVQKNQKETLPLLSPDWEPALESDLTRAILRVVNAKPPEGTSATAMQASAAAIEGVKHAIPNLASVSVEQGAQILREAGLKELRTAASEMETQLKEAQQHFTQVQKSGSAAEQQAARKHLMDLQTQQVERLKEIAARLQAQISALEQLKQQ